MTESPERVDGSEAAVAAGEPPPQQEEMPFAIVDGEPVTEMPRDLYIPPQALEVFLEAFEGPLDLLLYLIRRQNLDILDIPIADITRQYMEYIQLMQELDLELAGEYLLMAAMLAEIKSRMLLPRVQDGGDEEDDPRAELVRRLQEYERFKQAAEDIDRLPRLERDVYPAIAELTNRQVVRILPEVTLQEMLVAFKDVVQRATMFAHLHVQRETLSVRQRMSDVLALLEGVGADRVHPAVPARRGQARRDRDFRRDPRAPARAADRNRAGRTLRAPARAARRARPGCGVAR